jgi:SulP family sulfate permease
VLTLLGVILIDVLQGMVIGLLASLVFVIYRSSRPHLSSLGQVPGVPGVYSDLTRHPQNRALPGILIVRPDMPLWYANALTARDQVMAMIADSDPKPRAVIFDAAAQDELDLTSSEVIDGLVKGIHEQGIEVYFADVHAATLETARQHGSLARIGEDHVFPTVELAVRAAERAADQGAAPRVGSTPAGSAAQDQ